MANANPTLFDYAQQEVEQTVSQPRSAFFKDITGQKYNRLVVLGFAGRIRGGSYWKCRCDCGAEVVVRGAQLKNGGTKSCGCLGREGAATRARQRNYRHGMKGTPEYVAWRAMRDRCEKQDHPAYHNYGGRGITVCERWSGSDGFARFIEDMGRRPTTRHTLERRDNGKGYSPDNCRWATTSEQARNKRSNCFIEYDGKRMILADWAKETGLSRYCISGRLRMGWTVKDTLTIPQKRGGN